MTTAPLPAVPAAPAVRDAARRAARIAVPALVVALAGGLRLSNLGAVRPNPYYDAAVRTMGGSWHAFLFGLFAPASGLAIDKPPVDLWLQVASTKALGFSGPALLLPEALAGTLAVLLLFDLLRSLFGWTAGVAGAAVLAVLPIAVVTSRSDTMDSVMVALLLGAASLVARAARRPHGGTPQLLGAAALCGLAFEVKLLEAMIVLPALVLLFWSSAPDRARARRLIAMGAVFTVVALSWLTAVSLAPSHPWYIGSTNGSPWNATFVFNGWDRVTGPAPHPVPAPGDAAPASPRASAKRAAARARARRDHAVALLARPAAPGPARLLQRNADLRRRIGLPLLGAWFAALAALALGAPRRLGRPGRAGALALLVWLGTGTVLFSLMHRLEPRYLEAFTPAVAGVLGAGAVLATREAASRLRRPRAAPGIWLLALALVLAVPLAATAQIVRSGASDSGRPGALPSARVAALSAYLRDRQGRARYEVASVSAAKAGPVVVRDGRPVLVLTSLYGRPLVPVARLAALVREGEVRYALSGASCTAASGDRLTGCSAAARWIRAHGTDVSVAAQQPRRGLLYRLSPSRRVAGPARVRVRGRTPTRATSWTSRTRG